jgi:hypothetical protein
MFVRAILSSARFAQRFLISALVLAGCAIPASASTLTECTTTTCFNTASSGDTLSNIDFTAGSLGTSFTDLGSGVVFSTNSSGLTGIGSPSGWPAGTTDTALESAAGVNTMTITFPTAVNAIEFYAGMLDFSFFTISVTDSNGSTINDGSFEQTNLMVPKFFGITTTGSFTSFTITSQGTPDKITLDDVILGESGGGSSATPEGATMLLVATGLFGLRFARRWMRPAV